MKKTKIIIIAVFIFMCIIGAVSYYLLYVNPDILKKASEDINESEDTAGMYGSKNSYIYYPIDDELDVEAVKEYQELDRLIYFTENGESIALEENDKSYGNDVKFFISYFNTVIKGDYDTYNKLFTEQYFENNEKTCDFTQQMLYDINIEKLSEKVIGKEAVKYTYNVSYKIFRNNGTFRNDIGSDGSKTLYFELIEENGVVLIDKIDYYL